MAEHQKKTFTAAKLNWLDCVANDRNLKPAAFKVAYAIMQHVNAESLIAWLSDETLVDVTGISRAMIQRHRESLREAGWLAWERTPTANRYTPIFNRVNAGLEDILARRAKRKELRQARRPAPAQSTVASPARQHDASPAMQPDASPVRHIHLRTNTFDLTPSNPESCASGLSEVEPAFRYRQSKREAEHEFERLNELPWRQAGDDGDPEFDPGPTADRGALVRWHQLLKRGYVAGCIVRSAERYHEMRIDPVQSLARWLAAEDFTDPESESYVPEQHHDHYHAQAMRA
jgi:hypothetical protein